MPAIMVLATVGAAITTGIVAGDLSDWEGRGADFADAEPFGLWVMLVALMGGLWAVAAALMSGWLREVYEDGARKAGWLLGLTALVFLVLVPGLFLLLGHYRPIETPLPGRSAKLNALLVLGAVVALMSVWGLAGIYRAATRLRPEGGARAIRRYLRLRELLQRFLVAGGAILSMAVIASAAYRATAVADAEAHPREPGVDFPLESIVAYGIYLSAILALAYAPPYFRLRQAAEDMRESAFPLRLPQAGGWRESFDDRRRFGELLVLDAGPIAGFRAAVGILGPLLSALVAGLFPEA